MYQGLLMGKHVASACLDGAFGQVHSVFDKAVNIKIVSHGVGSSLLTLLCADSDIMPAAIVTSMRGDSWHDYCKVGNKIIFLKDAVFLNSAPFISGVSEAAVWEPTDPASAKGLYKLTYKEIAVRCEQTSSYIRHSGMNQNDFPIMRLSDFDVTKLLGLGNGLTPAGDDFLAGLLFAVHFAQMLYCRRCAYLPAIIKATLHNMTAKTNEISQHFLRYASEGLWGRATERFMLALFGNNDDMLRIAIKEKTTYGATSGIDEMSGIMLGLCETIKLFGEG